MKKKALALALVLALALTLLPSAVFAVSDAANGDWSAKTVTLKNTSEAELMVRVGDIDALNDEDDEYNPFTATSQRSHSYPWAKDAADPAGTDRIYVGSKYHGEASDGYSGNYQWYKAGDDTENAYGDGALVITMNYSASGITVKNALLQLCIDDFQALSWETNFTVKLNGKDAPFIAELLNHVDQTGPVSYIISAIIPPSFYSDIASGKLVITVDETTGKGDGYAIDFAKLLVNYNSKVFTGKFEGVTEPGATVRLLGTSTTTMANSTGRFSFDAVPGLNAVRASKTGYTEGYDFGIVFAKGAVSEVEQWEANVPLNEGVGNPDIDFSQFGETAAYTSSDWATEYLAAADQMNIIPADLAAEDLTKPITRAEFAKVAVKLYESMSGKKAAAYSGKPFSDTTDAEVLKAFDLNLIDGYRNDGQPRTDVVKFGPDDLLTREQMCAILARCYKKVNFSGWTLATDDKFDAQFKAAYTRKPITLDNGKKINAFTDEKDISSWAMDSVYFLGSIDAINGMGDGTFGPRNITPEQIANKACNATREQALKVAVCMAQAFAN
ncbi:MAG: carboxypeptidase regulatory-like domain-containing protein [Firmicutes bacterium]|nr:carboxypeptidase regulatory-like domain-containing protein [Bacillota bacterium]